MGSNTNGVLSAFATNGTQSELHNIKDEEAAFPSKTSRESSVDQGWAWVVLLASFLIHCVIFGNMMGLGLFYSEFLDEFGQGPVATSWLLGTNCALGALAGPIGSILANRFGFRRTIISGTVIAATGYVISYFVYDFWLLFLSFGVMTGLGSGIVYSPSFGILAVYFDKKKSLATSAVTVGIGLGMFIFPPLQRMMIADFTWRGASLITAAITLNIIPFAAIFSRDRVPGSKRSFSESADVSLFRKISFYVVLVQFFLMAGYNIFVVLGVRFATEFRGISKDDAPLILSAQGICNIFGRLSAVGISALRWTSSTPCRYFVFHVTTVGGALAIILYAVFDSLAGLCICSGCVGYFLGCRWALLPGIQMERFAAKRFSTSWSYGMFLLGIGSLVLPPFGEISANISDSPKAPFFLAGGCILVACLCTLTLQCCLPSRKKISSAGPDILLPVYD